MKNFFYQLSVFSTLLLGEKSHSLPSNFPNDEELGNQLAQMKQIYRSHMVPFSKAYQELKKDGRTNYNHGNLKTLFETLPRCSKTKQGTE